MRVSNTPHLNMRRHRTQMPAFSHRYPGYLSSFQPRVHNVLCIGPRARVLMGLIDRLYIGYLGRRPALSERPRALSCDRSARQSQLHGRRIKECGREDGSFAFPGPRIFIDTIIPSIPRYDPPRRAVWGRKIRQGDIGSRKPQGILIYNYFTEKVCMWLACTALLQRRSLRLVKSFVAQVLSGDSHPRCARSKALQVVSHQRRCSIRWISASNESKAHACRGWLRRISHES